MKEELIEKIHYYIERDGLDRNVRYQEIVYKRAYLMHILRKRLMTFYDIGLIFNRDHSTVVYQCKMVDRYLNKLRDKIYINTIKEYLEAFEGDKYVEGEIYIEGKLNLFEDVLNCKSANQLKMIQQRIRENKYTLDATILE